MGVLNAVIGDAAISFLWVFCVSTLGVFTSIIASYLGVQGSQTLIITTFLIFVLVLIFNFIAGVLGGASFNPTGNASFYAAGLGDDSLISMALRFPAQAIGAAGGAVAIKEVIPVQYKHLVVGPSLNTDLHTGAIVEGGLTFLISFVVLLIILKGPKSEVVKTLFIACSIMVVIISGSSYTGPSLNPANAYGWAYVSNWHNTWEQFYVYWISPFTGAILASWVFRAIFPPPVKQKKA